MAKNNLENVNSEDISRQIADLYGTKRELAQALGISESDLAHKLKRLSSKFVKQLSSAGIKVSSGIQNNIHHNKKIRDIENFQGADSGEIKLLKQTIEAQKEAIQALKDQIELLKSKGVAN